MSPYNSRPIRTTNTQQQQQQQRAVRRTAWRQAIIVLLLLNQRSKDAICYQTKPMLLTRRSLCSASETTSQSSDCCSSMNARTTMQPSSCLPTSQRTPLPARNVSPPHTLNQPGQYEFSRIHRHAFRDMFCTAGDLLLFFFFCRPRRDRLPQLGSPRMTPSTSVRSKLSVHTWMDAREGPSDADDDSISSLLPGCPSCSPCC